MQGETIAALSTPPGESGIAVVRVSGGDAEEILQRLTGGGHEWASHQLYRENIIDEHGDLIDEAMVVLMRAPHSYTGEDVVEISCHGGMQIVSDLMEAILRCGAVCAGPGEFTKRAYLNGKLDLAQAEAVADLIGAETKLQRQVALEHLEGGLSKCVREIEERILEHLMIVEAAIDFSEEDLPTYDAEAMLREVAAIRGRLAGLLESEVAGRKLRAGMRATIVGPRNAGKSSLYNALIGEERAIVSALPGTTRDLISERIHIGGFTFYLEDTAGIAETGCEIETKGISIGRRAAGRADCVIYVIDGSGALPADTVSELSGMKGKNIVCILNKKDLGLVNSEKEVARTLGISSVISTCAIDGDGLDELKAWIYETSVARGAGDMGRERIAVNARQAEALRAADDALERLDRALKEGVSEEILSLELRAAADECGAVTGRSVADDLLEAIFSRFCIGK
jgi:tRNA modification GTPase